MKQHLTIIDKARCGRRRGKMTANLLTFAAAYIRGNACKPCAADAKDWLGWDKALHRAKTLADYTSGRVS